MGGTLLLRDTAKQVQDITTLSRDVEHANNALSPIFNKEKEQKRLKQAQLIGEIGAQVMDIVRTEGELKAQKAAEAKGDATVKRPQDGDSAQEWEVYKKALTESPTYKAEMQKYGTGSDFQRAAQAATAAIQALAGGDIQKAIASGASPYLAQLVKDVTLLKDESKITASDIAANAMAHAVVGAVVAQLSGQDAAAGAIGASSGELAARAIMAEQYPGKTANDLTEEEKQSVSALSTLASGLISGLASNSTATAASGAQSGRNAVENNYLSSTEKSRQTELNHKQSLTPEEQKERDALNRKDAETSKALIDACMGGSADACTAARQDALEKQDTYQNLSYQNPKEAQKGYQQIQQLLSGTSAEAIQTQELFNGMVAAYMRTGMTEEAAKSAVGYQLGTMYIIGGIAGIGSGKAVEGSLTDKNSTVKENVGIKPTVTAELEANGQKFKDTNQTARPAEQANKNEPTLIADRIASKEQSLIDKGKTNNLPLPNSSMANAHAEIGVIQQAYNAGKTQNANLTINVAGKDVCSYCRGDIAAAAQASGAKSVTINAVDDKTGLPKTYVWESGMKSIKEINR
ncbi:Hemolysin [Pectobacterium sp. F1-1]|uniref:VENN motif pre-toxin domain-containing protein n=1 Tax=Pectobacterium sp. F1-1 TaxID=2949614 RepID=UPI0021D7D037|nr:VENN motif pre-toxin domain-containing protein [Pectobacterium sp. F1-1]UYA60509.1 Hemolysin [Pectobacterium sp. F1-1]